MHFALTHANTDSAIMKLFFIRFCDLLDAKDPLWRDNAVLLLDNARYHISEEILAVLQQLRIPTMFSGPYSYSAAPCELAFAALKRGDLNPKNLPTGKSKCPRSAS